MSRENTKNVIILKNLPSNLISEAILVVKDKKQVTNYMRDAELNEQRDVSNCKTSSNGIIYGDMKTEALKKIENIKKEDRKYVIKEAEIVVSNYIKRIEDNLSDRKIDRLKKSYKKTKKLNVLLAMTTIISILLAICIWKK